MPIKKNGGKSAKPIQTDVAIEQANKQSFCNLPTSPASNLILEVLGSGKNLLELIHRKSLISKGTELSIDSDGEQYSITSKTSSHNITIKIADINKLIGSNKAAKKMFVYTLIKANEQAIFNGEVGRDYVSFPLSELIEIGFYKTPQSARKGFYAAMDALTDIKLNGEIQVTKKNKISVIGSHPIRYGIIDNNQCYVFLESSFNWRSLMQYFTILPRYYFKLSNRASDLLYYIFYIARQRTKDIKERGGFTISLRAIHGYLRLPNETGLNNPQRDIKQPIEDAIEQIENEHNAMYGNLDFSLLPVCDDSLSISDYLDNGYLKIELKGDFATNFIRFCKSTEKKIKDNKQKQERIAEKAIAIKLAKDKKQEHSTGE